MAHATDGNKSARNRNVPEGSADSSLLPMLIWGLVLIILGMGAVMIFA